MNLIINGITDSSFNDFEKQLEQTTHKDSTYFKLRDMTINYCQGCWDCWVKTPGKCAIKDDYEQILSMIPSADVVTVITPIIAGYESSLVKTYNDRMIPIAHPYIKIYKGEQHHRQRYPKNPDYKLIILEDEYTTEEDIRNMKELYERRMLNFKAELIEVITLKKGAEFNHVINDI